MPGLLGRATSWCEANEQPETAIGYAQEAGDVDRVARLVERCALPAYQSGRVATAERWLEWLEEHGALERNAVVAVLGALLATLWGRPAEAERRADAAERASYDGTLPDGSASIDSWLALLRAQRCRHGVARMRADAELALRTLARGSPFRPHAVLLLAVSQWLAGEVDQADDLFADVVEEGLELGAPEAVAVALGERAAIAIGRGAWVQAEELADRALAGHPPVADGASTPPARFVYAVAARVALHRGEAQRAHELLARAQRLRPGLTYALPYLSVQTRLELARAYLTIADAGGAETMLREIETAAAPATGPRHAPGPGGGAALEPEDDARRRPRGLDPDRGGAARAPLPRHAPLLPRDRRAPVPVAPHGEVTRDGDLPQAQRHLAATTRSNAPARLGLL